MRLPRTHCRSGRHELTPENTIQRPQGRLCRPCAQEKWTKPKPELRPCVVCDTLFQPRDKGERYAYCGTACHNTYRAAKRYGLTVAEYRAMVAAQGGRCLICKKRKKLVIDHCHNSTRVRGLLCSHCNSGLGYFFDTPERLEEAAVYLRRNS